MSKNIELILRIRALVEGIQELGILDRSVTAVGDSAQEAGGKSQALNGALDQLGKEQQVIDSFTKLKKELKETADQLEKSKTNTTALGKELGTADKPTRALGKSFSRAKTETQQLSKEYQAQRLKMQALRQEMSKMGVSSKGLNQQQKTIRNELKQTEKNLKALLEKQKKVRTENNKPLKDPTKKLQQGLKETNSVMQEMQAEIARLLTAAGLAKFVKDSVSEVRKAEASFLGLKSIAEHAGVGIGEAFKAAADLSADGLLLVADASKSLQNLLSRGYSLDEAVQTINRLKDAAAFNRSAHLSMSEAVLTATEGLKNENSVLVDNAGVTKNVSILWKEYADTVGKGVLALTKAEKIQAEVNGIMRETEGQAGNAAKALEGVEGKIAGLNKSINELHVAFGVSLFPSLGMLAELGNTVIDDFVKPFLGGIEILALKTGALVSSLDELWVALTGDDDEAAAAIEKITRNYALLDEMAIDVVNRYEEGLIPAAQAATKALDGQSDATVKVTAAQAKQAEESKTLAANLKTIGLNAEIVTGKMTAFEVAGVAAFEGVTTGAEQSALVIDQVFSAALKKMASEQGLDQLKTGLQTAFDAGRISAESLAEKITQVDARLTELTGGTDRVEEAFKQLGITSRAELKKLADQAQVNFEIIRDEGTKAPAEIEAAFLSYAEKSIKANDGVVSAQLRTQGATLGIAVGLQNLDKVSVATTSNMIAGFQRANAVLEQTVAGLHNADGSLNRINDTAGGASFALRGMFGNMREEFEAMGDDIARQFDEIVRSTGEAMQGSSINMYLDAVGRKLNDLRDHSLYGLQRQVQGVTDRVDGLTDSASRANDQLADLNQSLSDQVDQMNGNYEAVELRRYREQLEEINRLAEESGNKSSTNARRARQNARQLHEQRMQEIKAESAATEQTVDSVVDGTKVRVDELTRSISKLASSDLSPVINQLKDIELAASSAAAQV